MFISVAITVRNQGENENTTFEEETRTLVVSAHGALIELAAKIEEGQPLRLKNRATGEEQVCKAVYLGPASGDKVQVGIEFASRVPDFWRIAFPPQNWSVHQQARANREN